MRQKYYFSPFLLTFLGMAVLVVLQQSPESVLTKTCSENMQQVYRKTQEVLQLYGNHHPAWVHIIQHIFGKLFHRAI